jgi:hypothetical protein
MNPGMSSSPPDLDGLRRLMALITSESETDAKFKNSKDDRRMEKTTGQGLLYTDLKCLENSSATSLGLIKCLPSTSSWMELELLSNKILAGYGGMTIRRRRF